MVFFQRQVNHFKLVLELLEIPIAVLAGLVVHETEEVYLLLGQLVSNNAGNGLYAEFTTGADSRMTRHDDIVHIYDDRHEETKAFDAVLDLFDSQIIVTRIVLVFSQP